MLECVKNGMKSRDMSIAFDIFEKWDHKFTLDSTAATLFTEWENTMAAYFHETTIGSKDVRVSLQNHPAYMSSFYLRVRQWSQEKATKDQMCYLVDLNSQNTC